MMPHRRWTQNGNPKGARRANETPFQRPSFARHSVLRTCAVLLLEGMVYTETAIWPNVEERHNALKHDRQDRKSPPLCPGTGSHTSRRSLGVIQWQPRQLPDYPPGWSLDVHLP